MFAPSEETCHETDGNNREHDTHDPLQRSERELAEEAVSFTVCPTASHL
jgi:hypothetical protein